MAAINYLQGKERPTADLMNQLFANLDDKLTRLLGGRSFFLAQTAAMPQYLIGKAFFFTAGTAIYAPRVPGYFETGSTGSTAIDPATGLPVTTPTTYIARPYNHAQFLAAQAGAVLQPAYLQAATLANAGHSYLLNDVLTLAGGTVAPGGQPAQLQVTLKDASGEIVAFNIVNPGSYSVPPPTPNTPIIGGHGNGAVFNLTLFQLDEVNKVAPLKTIGSPAYQGLPQASDVGLFEWSLAAHSILHQGQRDKSPVRYYLQDGATTPEKHLKFALAEIIMEGVQSVTMEKSWDKYACFRVHNLNAKPAVLTFAGDNFSVNLGPFQCATIQRDWNGTKYINYRRGYNYFFKFAGGDPRFYWFFPTSGGFIGYGGRAANSMQANNLSNPAILLDWMQLFQRTADAKSVFAAFQEDPAVQCDIYSFYHKLFGDPANPATLVGDLLHHKGDILIVRASLEKRDPVSHNPLLTFDQVTFNGYATIVADFAKKQLQVRENSDGNLTVTNIDPANNVFLCPISTNLFKLGDNLDGNWLGLILGWPDKPFINNGSAPTQKGIPLLSTALHGGGNSVVIENAIFESQPEQPWLTSTTLTTSGPQLIQQPLATVTTPQKTWNDIYNVVSAPPPGPAAYVDLGADPNTPGHHLYMAGYVANGSPQTTLNWNTSARGLLNLPTILDGGSGYQIGDAEQLTGGSGDPAVIIVKQVKNGEVTQIQMGFAGNYLSVPNNPNSPKPIYPTDRQGSGLLLGGISVPLKTMNGIHKVTVADLLKLDWWGDPRAGDQSSPYVILTNRTLTLTPQGLVLTFTETDSPLPGDSFGQPANLPTWASGKRGLPRNRTIRFRGHGWGFVGGGSDTEAVNADVNIPVSPSAKSGMLSPRYGRFEIAGGYNNETVAPNGADFSAKIAAKQNTLKLLTRIKATALGLPGSRFWQAAAFDNAANFLPQTKGAPAPYFFETWEFLINAAGYPANTIAMGLIPEMYNALARAVNAVASGTSLVWQCLSFNVQGHIVALAPQVANTFGLIGPNPAGDILWWSGFTHNGYNFYTGPRPMNQFFAFDQGSLYEALMHQLGVTVRTENDLPGGNQDGTDHSFSFFQNQISAPAVYYDFAQANTFGGGASIVPSVTNSPNVPNGSLTVAGNINIELKAELLSTADLLAGTATGSRCLGTYDPTQYNPPGLLPMPGIPPQSLVPYPDFTNAPPGSFYVASDGSGRVATADGQRNVLGGVLSPGLARRQTGDWLDLTKAFAGYRWVQIADVQQLVAGFGFPFLWEEACTPLELKYFSDPTEQNIIDGIPAASFPFENDFGWFDDLQKWDKIFPEATIALFGAPDVLRSLINSDGTVFWSGGSLDYFDQAGNKNIFFFRPGTGTYWIIKALAISQTFALIIAVYELPAPASLLSDYVNSQKCFAYSFSANVNHAGTLIKFCTSADPQKSLWKTQMTLSSGAAEIVNVRSRTALSPIFRWLGFSTASISFSFGYFGSAGCSMGVSISGAVQLNSFGQRPSSIPNPQLAVQYVSAIRDFSSLLATNYNEGSLFDQFETLAFNIYSTAPIAPIPVLMSPNYAWEKQRDWWGDLDNVYAASQFDYYGNSNVPWQFVAPPQSFIFKVTDYSNGAGQNGLTILSPAADQRYWCCFDLSQPAIAMN